MSEACASGAPRHEVALPRCAVSSPVTSLSAAETAARGDVVATVTAAAKAAGTIAAPLGPNWATCTTAGSSGAVVVAYSAVAASAAAAALFAPAPAVAISSRTAAAAARVVALLPHCRGRAIFRGVQKPPSAIYIF